MIEASNPVVASNPDQDFTKLLEDAARSDIAILHEFRIQYYSDDLSVHLFFEGPEDRVYYMPSIRRRCRVVAHCYDCAGKRNLRRLRPDVYRIASDISRCLFFVDRDHDDFTNTQIEKDTQTYITDFYSIESSLATRETVEILLADIIGLAKTQSQFKMSLQAFDISRRTFFIALRPIMAWVIAGRIDRQELNLNNVDLSKVVIRNHSGHFKRRREGFAYFTKQVGASSYRPKRDLYRRVMHMMHECDMRLWMRGKYELWFFVTEMRAQISPIVGKPLNSGRKIKCPQGLVHNAAIEFLSGQIPIPESASEFLDAHFV